MLASLADKKGKLIASIARLKYELNSARERTSTRRRDTLRLRGADRRVKKEKGNVQKAARNLLHAAWLRAASRLGNTRPRLGETRREAFGYPSFSTFLSFLFSFFLLSCRTTRLLLVPLSAACTTLCTLLRCKCHVNFAILTDFSVNSTRCCHARHNVDMPRINNRMNERFNENTRRSYRMKESRVFRHEPRSFKRRGAQFVLFKLRFPTSSPLILPCGEA